jgi:NADH dehydrogenase
MVATAPSLPHVVIIGGGFGGLRAAHALVDGGCRITVIDRSNHHLFQPLLYQVATAGLSPGEIAAPIRMILGKNRNTEVLMSEVVDIDTENQRVLLNNADPVSFDYLIVATGARHSYFGHDEWEAHAPGLKSIADATKIRRRILKSFEAAEIEDDVVERQAFITVVLVGAGPTGVEMAGSIAELAHQVLLREFKNFSPDQTRILLIEAGPRILSSFPESLASAAQDTLEKMGVEVRTNTRVEDIDANGVLANAKRIAAKTVIWAAGVKASPAGEWLKVKTDSAGRVPVDASLRAPGHENIFVIGDTALALDHDGKPLPGVAAVAMQQGTYVGNYVRRKIYGDQPVGPFQYHDKGSLATIGRASAIAHIGKLKLSGFFAWIIWLFVHILYLIGFRNRVLVLIQWASAYFTYQRGVRLIVEEPESDARPS